MNNESLEADNTRIMELNDKDHSGPGAVWFYKAL